MVYRFLPLSPLLRCCLPLLLCVGLLPRAEAALALTVVAEVHTQALPGAIAAPPDSREVLEVTLGDDYLLVDRAAVRMLYDFGRRRHYVIDTAHRRYVDYSLYSIVGFRTMELRHRANMQAMLAAADVKLPVTRAIDREQELSVAENADAVIEETMQGGERVFTSEGRALASWRTRGTQVESRDAAHFARFLRYTQAGHPQLLARLAQGTLIPQQLRFTIATVAGVRTVQLTVSNVRHVAAAPLDLSAYAPRDDADDAVDALLDRMAAQTPQQLAALRAAHPCDTADAYRADALLDTMLGRTECVLATGAAMLPFTPEQLEQVRADGGVALMFAAIGPKSPAEYEASVKTLAALRTQAPRKAYMLQLFEANNRRYLGQQAQSRQLFEQVLAANPVLGGAYKDLGDLLLTQFDSARAWRSWDIGRRIAPRVANFDAVDKLEHELVTLHPEFFEAGGERRR